MSNLTKQGMADGVRGSAVFALFSRGVLERPFVRFEVSEALKQVCDGFEAPAAPGRPIRSGRPLFEGGFAPFVAL